VDQCSCRLSAANDSDQDASDGNNTSPIVPTGLTLWLPPRVEAFSIVGCASRALRGQTDSPTSHPRSCPPDAAAQRGLTRSNGWGLSLLGSGATILSVHRSLQILALLAVAIGASACESFDVLGPQRSAALLHKIQIGMNQTEVIDQLGKPHREEVQGTTQLLFYQTAWQIAEEAKQRSPIAIRDGKVVGLGTAYLKNLSNPADPWTAWMVQVSEQPSRSSRQVLWAHQ
jgi:hypothetical protein